MADPLADSASPFLRHGATQPVEWRPWGKAAFERARELDRPVLLDIGAVWCHWCHVMDRESYEDPETAGLINERFVPVKVDRDERPDVDARYQRAVQMLVGQGGWPLTGFLTPDGELFHGGTYFPPEDAHGRPSFRRVLLEVARVWDEERGRVREAVDAIGQRLTRILAAEAGPGELDPGLPETAVDELLRSFDPTHGGFGQAPKFPNPGGLALLLDHWLDEGFEPAAAIVRTTLDAMIDGGIHDQLGGGFHRYSTDARWIIPHFEKMAYDNGALLEVLARASAALDEPGFGRAARGVLRYYRDVAGDLAEAGGFPASQDADHSPDDDGDYWTWSEAEIRATLGPDAAEAALVRYGVREAASAMHLDPRRHVLYRAETVPAVADRLARPEAEVRALLREARDGLLAARSERPRPYVDTTLYSGWVAMVAAGHLAAARHLAAGPPTGDAGDEGPETPAVADARDAALRALERVWMEGWSPGRGVAHRVGDPEGVVHLFDQAHLAGALLDAFELTQDGRWLDRAMDVVAVIRGRFAHPSGGLTDVPVDGGGAVGLLNRPRLEITDAPEPSATATAALSVLRLAALQHDDPLADAGRAILRAYAGSAPRFAGSAATFFRAVRWATRPITSVVLVEAEDGELLPAALRPYRPNTVVRRFAPDAVDRERLAPAVAAMLDGRSPRAYVCEGTTCAPPVDDAEGLAALLRRGTG